MKHLIPTALIAALLLAGCDKLKLGKEAGKGDTTAEEGVVRDLTAEDFDRFVATPGKLVVVDFHAEWCGPCKQLGPLLEEVSAEFKREAVLGKVDVDAAGDLPGRLGVSSIPDVRLYRDGVMVDRFVGLIAKEEVRARFQRHTFGLTGKPPAEGEAQEGQPQPVIQPMEKDWLPPGIERK